VKSSPSAPPTPSFSNSMKESVPVVESRAKAVSASSFSLET
jgi:hypothetical protein